MKDICHDSLKVRAVCLILAATTVEAGGLLTGVATHLQNTLNGRPSEQGNQWVPHFSLSTQ